MAWNTLLIDLGKLSWLYPLLPTSCPPQPAHCGWQARNRDLVLYKHCSAKAKTLVLYQHRLNHRSTTWHHLVLWSRLTASQLDPVHLFYNTGDCHFRRHQGSNLGSFLHLQGLNMRACCYFPEGNTELMLTQKTPWRNKWSKIRYNLTHGYSQLCSLMFLMFAWSQLVRWHQ